MKDKWIEVPSKEGTIVPLSKCPEVVPLKVSAKTAPEATAGAIVGIVCDESSVDIQAVGAGAVNQATKALAIAMWRFWKESKNSQISCKIRFADIVIDGENRTAMRWTAYLTKRKKKLSGISLLPISAKTHPSKTAGAIAGLIKAGERGVAVQGVGAAAVNQAVKSVAIATKWLEDEKILVDCDIYFEDVASVEGENITAMRLVVSVVE